jgi:uncharacterized protein YbjT (DUF2867 family)
MADLGGMQQILVIGGTGRMGVPTVQELIGRGAHVRVMTRSATKAAALAGGHMTGVAGDLNRSYSLREAFDGIDVLILITAHSITETGQGLAAVSTALAGRVRRIIFLSSAVGPGAMRIPHVAAKAPVEHALITSRTDYTIVRAHSLFQNDISVDSAIQDGHYPLPVGNNGISRVDVRDVADALANAALESGHERRIYTLGTPERFTGESIARAYGARYCGDDLDKWERFVAASKPKWQRDDLRIMFRYYQECGMTMSLHDLIEQERILGADPRPFVDYIAERAAVRDGDRACAGC